MFNPRNNIHQFSSFRQRLIENSQNISLPKEDVMELHRNHVVISSERETQIAQAGYISSRTDLKNIIQSAQFASPDDLYDLPQETNSFHSNVTRGKLSAIEEIEEQPEVKVNTNSKLDNPPPNVSEKQNDNQHEKVGFWSMLCCKKLSNSNNSEHSRG